MTPFDAPIPAHGFVTMLLFALFMSMSGMITFMYLDSRRGAWLKRILIHRHLKHLRLERMMKMRRIDVNAYVASNDPAVLDYQLANCADCDHKPQCDSALKAGTIQRLAFCPNDQALRRYVAEHRTTPTDGIPA